jgi:osmotically-inducible protein OsmY
VGEQIGRKIDQGLTQIGDELRQGWASMRESVDRLGVQGRVYGRLHWDKQLVNANLEIGMQGNDVVILKGTVPTMAAKTAAGRLAEETIGVQSVVNELVVSGAGR